MVDRYGVEKVTNDDDDKGLSWYHWLLIALALGLVGVWLVGWILMFMSGGGHV